MIRFRNCGDDAIVGLPSFGVEIAENIAALSVEEFDVWILYQLSLDIWTHVHPIASGGDGGSDEFSPDDRRRGIIEIGLELGHPVGVNVTGDHNKI